MGSFRKDGRRLSARAAIRPATHVAERIERTFEHESLLAADPGPATA